MTVEGIEKVASFLRQSTQDTSYTFSGSSNADIDGNRYVIIIMFENLYRNYFKKT